MTVDSVIELLHQRLTGTRRKARGTTNTYIQDAKAFLDFCGSDTFTRADVDRYISALREKGNKETTLRRKLSSIAYLAGVLDIDLKLKKDDYPRTSINKDDEDENQPTLTVPQVEQLIMTQDRYSKEERFYLSVSTTYAARRIALSLIKKRDFDITSILIRGTHNSKPVRHLIPDVLKPIFQNYNPDELKPDALSKMFHRILNKAELAPGLGYGWHSIRRLLDTLAWRFPPDVLIIWADYTGWVKEKKGRFFMQSAMAGHYEHSKAVESDPYYFDRAIFPVHPFLKTWEKALSKNGNKLTSSLTLPNGEPVKIPVFKLE
jgi:hypothetical protein